MLLRSCCRWHSLLGETSQRSVWLTPISCDPCRHPTAYAVPGDLQGAGGITDGANDAWYERVRARARTIDGSLLTFQDAVMKVVVDGLGRSALSSAEPCGVSLRLRCATSERVSRRNAETLSRGEYVSRGGSRSPEPPYLRASACERHVKSVIAPQSRSAMSRIRRAPRQPSSSRATRPGQADGGPFSRMRKSRQTGPESADRRCTH